MKSFEQSPKSSDQISFLEGELARQLEELIEAKNRGDSFEVWRLGVVVGQTRRYLESRIKKEKDFDAELEVLNHDADKVVEKVNRQLRINKDGHDTI